jgi:hypothetical protein
MTTNSLKHSYGFTLIETVTAIFAVTVLVSVLYALEHTVQTNQMLLFNSYLSVDSTNANVSFLTKTIRTVQPSQNGSYPILTAQPNELVVFSDVDFDGIVERVRFRRNGTVLQKGITKPQGSPATYPDAQEKINEMVNGITNGNAPIFTYYNENWPKDLVNNPLSMPAGILKIRLIKISIKTNLGTKARDEYALDTFVQLRTLKDNF